jgi:hypothetical protein
MRVSSFSHSEAADRNIVKEHTNSFRSAGWTLDSFSPIYDREQDLIVGTRFLWRK